MGRLRAYAFVAGVLGGSVGMVSCLVQIDDALADRAGDGAAPGDAPADQLDADGAESGGYRGVVLADKPIGYWRLGDKVTPTARDETGEHPGTYAGPVTLGVPGALIGDEDTATRFDGTAGTYVDIPGAAFQFAGAASFSIEAWARPNFADAGANTYLCLAANDARGDAAASFLGYQVWLHPSYGLGFERYVSSGVESVGTTVPDSGAYMHLLAVYDGNAGAMLLYVNGEPGTSRPADPNAEAYVADFKIGGRLDFSCFTGDIDEVAVYDRALSVIDAQRHYQAGLGR